MWRDVIESVHSKRGETNFRLLFLACETLQFSLVMRNIHTNALIIVLWVNQEGELSSSHFFFNFFQQNWSLWIKLWKVLICVILQIGHKNSILAVFTWKLAHSWLNPRWRPRWWPFLVTLRASNSPFTHKIIPHLVEKIKGSPQKAKSFWNTATYQKL